VLSEEKIVETLRSLKPQYEKEGIEIVGFFGSYARGEATEKSDLDVLIETRRRFVEETDPLKAFSRLRELKQQLQRRFGLAVDIADRSGLNAVAGKFIMKDLRRV